MTRLFATNTWSQCMASVSILLVSLHVCADWVVSRDSTSVCDAPDAVYQTAEETEEPSVTDETEKGEQPDEEEEEEPDCD